MAVQIATGSSTAGLANVNSNFEVQVAPTGTAANAGFVAAVFENDAGLTTGSRQVRAPEVTSDFRLRVGVDAPLFSEFFPGTTLNSALWTAPVTTNTITQTGGWARLNGTTTASAVARLATYKHFTVMPGSGLTFRCRAQFTVNPPVNTVHEWGMFIASGTTAPTDGAFFRVDATQVLRCVTTINGVETESAALTFSTLVGAAASANFAIDIYEDGAAFFINDRLVATVSSAIGSIGAQCLPVAFRLYNTASAPAIAQTMQVSSVNVNSADIDCARDWATAMCGAGGTGLQGQTGMTMGSTAALGNSATPTATVLTNTTAALTPNGLGGQFYITDTLATGTDGIVSSYQVPAATATVPGKTLMIRGVTINLGVQTVYVSTGHLAQWYLAFGHNAVSLATTETATSKAPRRVPLGMVAVPANAAVNTVLGQVAIRFDAPIPVFPGEFVQTVLKRIGTVPTSGVMAALITFDAFWE